MITTIAAPGRNLYVSTSLDYFQEPEDSPLAKDFILNGVTYRRLDFPYLAWLNQQFERAAIAVDKGKLDMPTFCRLHEALADIFEFAQQQVKGEKIFEVLKRIDLTGYEPPKSGVWQGGKVNTEGKREKAY